jgi:hypothetical protein
VTEWKHPLRDLLEKCAGTIEPDGYIQAGMIDDADGELERLTEETVRLLTSKEPGA